MRAPHANCLRGQEQHLRQEELAAGALKAIKSLLQDLLLALIRCCCHGCRQECCVGSKRRAGCRQVDHAVAVSCELEASSAFELPGCSWGCCWGCCCWWGCRERGSTPAAAGAASGGGAAAAARAAVASPAAARRCSATPCRSGRREYRSCSRQLSSLHAVQLSVWLRAWLLRALSKCASHLGCHREPARLGWPSNDCQPEGALGGWGRGDKGLGSCTSGIQHWEALRGLLQGARDADTCCKGCQKTCQKQEIALAGTTHLAASGSHPWLCTR